MTQQVFVTGGAGFIGSHITDSLLSLGYRVKVFDNLSSGSLDNLQNAKKNKNFSFVQGDISDYELLKKSMDGSDYVSHHAAQLEIFLALDNPQLDLDVNTVGTLNVLKAAKNTGIRKVVNISSACIYGQSTRATSEDFLPNPNWDYGVSKLAAEKYAQIYNDSKDLNTVSLRYAIVYGSREWYRRVMPIFIKRIILNQPLVIFGDGQQIRDFIHVDDVVDFHNICMFSDLSCGQAFNVGTGIPTTIKSLAETIIKVSGANSEIIYESTREGGFSTLVKGKKRNSSELKQMLLNIDKAYDLLGWKPKITLDKGIDLQLKWASHNLDRWSKVFTTQW